MPDPPGRDEYYRARHASPLRKYEHIAKFRGGRGMPRPYENTCTLPNSGWGKHA